MATPSLAPSSRRGSRSPRSAPGASGSSPRSASRPAIDERAGLEVAQPRLDALGDGGPRRRVLAGRQRAGVDEDVRAIEIAARGARAGLGDVERSVVERLEQRAHQVLRGQALDVLDVAQRESGLVGHGVQQLLVLDREGAHAAAHGDERPELVAVVAQRGARLDARLGQLAARIEGDQLEPAVLAVAQPQLARVVAEQAADALGDHLIELLAPAHRDDAVAELGEVRHRVDAQAGLLVQARVLDRARDERRGVHEEVQHALVELARSDGVQHDDAQHLARARGHRHGHHRLEVLLLELGHVLHARVRRARPRG